MPFLKEIVEAINTLWQNNLPDSIANNGQNRFLGIAETIIEPVEDDGNLIVMRYPGLIDFDGDAKVETQRYGMIDIDDEYGLTVYHRLESINNTYAKNGFGDELGDLIETVNMAVIVIAFRNITPVINYQFEAYLKSKIPNANNIVIGGKKVQSTTIRVTNTNFDKLQILAREYAQIKVEYPELTVFEMKYRIDNTWKKGCFEYN